MDRLTTRIPGGVEVVRRDPAAVMFRLAKNEETAREKALVFWNGRAGHV